MHPGFPPPFLLAQTGMGEGCSRTVFYARRSHPCANNDPLSPWHIPREGAIGCHVPRYVLHLLGVDEQGRIENNNTNKAVIAKRALTVNLCLN